MAVCVRWLRNPHTTLAGASNGRLVKKATSVRDTALLFLLLVWPSTASKVPSRKHTVSRDSSPPRESLQSRERQQWVAAGQRHIIRSIHSLVARCPGFCAPPATPVRDCDRGCNLSSHSRPAEPGLRIDAGLRSDRSRRRPQELICSRWFTPPELESLQMRAPRKRSGGSRSSTPSCTASTRFPSPSVSTCSIMFDISITSDVLSPP